MTSKGRPRPGLNFLVLALLILAAAFVRYRDLDTRGVGHIEMYTPNIPLPAGISDPPARMTIVSTLTGSLWEPHPPAWYLANYPWTKAFGVSPAAMRLPSVVAGVVAVLLLWWFAIRERSRAVALVAATLLAANGLHIMWSQLSRPVIVVAAFGIASSVALLRLTAGPSRSKLASYLCLSLAGLATDHYYWFLLGGQFVWVYLLSRTRTAMAGLVDWQFVAMAAASPLLTLAIAQSRESYLSASLFETAANYAAFGFLFQTVESTYTAAVWMPAAAIALGLLLASVGLTRSRASVLNPDATVAPPSGALTTAIGIGATGAVVATAFVLSSAGMGQLPRMLATAVAPALFLILARAAQSITSPRLPAVPPLSSILCTVPVAVVFAISLVIPFVDTKYFLLFTPFLLVQIAEGLVAFVRGSRTARSAAVVATVLIAVLHWASWQVYRGVDSTPIDFRALAADLAPAIGPTDRVLVYKHYAMTPVFYYLRLDASRYVGVDHAAIRKAGASRFWLISLRDTGIEDPPGYAEATAGCQLAQTIAARRIRAERHERCASR